MSDATEEHPSDNHIAEEDENGDQMSVSNEDQVIADDSVLNKSYPLKHEWGFYFLSNEKSLDWMQRLSRICTLKTVEEFWAFIDRVRPPSFMQQCDYSLFKYQIQPVWEEAENKNGGRIVFQLPKHEQNLLNEMWMKLMLGMIGGYFGDLIESICGAVCSSRQKGSKISLWVTETNDEPEIKQVAIKLTELWAGFDNKRLGGLYPFQSQIHFENHCDAQIKTSSQGSRKIILW